LSTARAAFFAIFGTFFAHDSPHTVCVKDHGTNPFAHTWQ
jgi:hypothetical protein